MKYEAVYLQDIEDGFEATRIVDGWINLFQPPAPAFGAWIANPERGMLRTKRAGKSGLITQPDRPWQGRKTVQETGTSPVHCSFAKLTALYVVMP